MKYLISIISALFFASMATAGEIDNTVSNIKMINKNSSIFLEFTEGNFSEIQVGRTTHRYTIGRYRNSIEVSTVYNDIRETLSFRNTYNFNTIIFDDVRLKTATTLSYAGNVSNYDDGDFYISASIEATKPISGAYHVYGKYGASWDLDGLDRHNEYILLGMPVAINKTTYITPSIVKSKVHTNYGTFEQTNLEVDLTFLF